MMLPDKITTLAAAEFPPLLAEITDPPKKLYVRGIVPPPEHKWLCVVGSRSYSPYAKDAVEKLVGGLAGYPVVIVSGLALGLGAQGRARAQTSDGFHPRLGTELEHALSALARDARASHR